MLPPAEHSFWRQPDAAEAVLEATLQMELDRLAALESLEEARQRLEVLNAVVVRAQKEASAAKAAVAEERAGRERAELYASERGIQLAKLQVQLPGPNSPGDGAGDPQGSAGTKRDGRERKGPVISEGPQPSPGADPLSALRAENERLTASVAEWSNRAKRAEDELARTTQVGGESVAQARQRAAATLPRVAELEGELAALWRRYNEAASGQKRLQAEAERVAQEAAAARAAAGLAKASTQAAEENAAAWQAKHAAERVRTKELSAALAAVQEAAAAAKAVTARGAAPKR